MRVKKWTKFLNVGYHGPRHAHRAKATSDGAKKNPKRILGELIGENRERRLRCLTLPLDKLREMGAESGLRHFLDEVQTKVVPRATRLAQ